jgi:putative DNA methylase
VSQESAALASSIFLVARKREGAAKGSYEEEVRPQLEQIVRERVMNLWEMGIGGADLVIAAVGAGLRAFTRFARVDYANGEEVPAQRFLTEVETVVLETILSRLSKEVGGKEGLATVDPATRFYILWRYTYRSGDLDAGEAIIFANGTHVELDGLGGLSSGVRALIEKEKGTYRLLDYTERGDDKMLGMPSDNGQPAPLIDALQRTLWLMEKRPGHLDDFLREAQPNLEQMRLVAQALAGSALKGKSDEDKALMSTTQSEQSALGKLLANWRALVEQPTGPLFDGRRA